ncbi:MAG: DUF2461 domain-containing protein [Acidobacteriota bacterium]
MKRSVPLAGFRGFTPTTLEFLAEVKRRDSRDWFEAHRPVYEEHVLGPCRELVAALAELMVDIDAGFDVSPLIGATISRLRRDTRFSRDPSLYRDHVWLAFRRRREDWQDAPAYFFEISPTGWRYGMGYYQASRRTMDGLRRRIDRDPARFVATIAFCREGGGIELVGERYRRPLPCDHGPEVDAFYQCKSFYLVGNRGVDELLFSPDLATELEGAFHALAPLYRFLLEVSLERAPAPGR